VPYLEYGKNGVSVNYGTIEGFSFVAERVWSFLGEQTY
jgi:hypothetical protein